MNFFEDLGSQLDSLSINDRLRLVTAHDEDAMDLDPETSLNNFRIDLHTEGITKKANNEDDIATGCNFYDISLDNGAYTVEIDEDGDKFDVEDSSECAEAGEVECDSFLGILSPTKLGARFALQPQKLLMGPPTIDRINRKSSIDYEFDTSTATRNSQLAPLTLHKHNASSYEDLKLNVFKSGSRNFGLAPNLSINGQHDSSSAFVNIRDGFDVGSIDSMSSSGLGPRSYSSGIFSHELFASFGRQPHTVIHHHHYYSGPKDFAATSSHDADRLHTQRQELINSQGTQIVSHPNLNDGEANVLSKYRNHHFQDPDALAHSRNGPYLPSPWNTRAMPAERLPYILLSYLQLLTNTLLSAFALHLLVVMVQAVRNDVSLKMAQETNSLLVEIALCQRAYHENFCNPIDRVPALEKMCEYWEKCMAQNPTQMGNRSLIGAYTLGVILNSLVEPMGLKVLGVGAFFVILVFGCNFGFGYIRAKAYYGILQQST